MSWIDDFNRIVKGAVDPEIEAKIQRWHCPYCGNCLKLVRGRVRQSRDSAWKASCDVDTHWVTNWHATQQGVLNAVSRTFLKGEVK
jgi:hypothetical protein